jgi:hypothetical protein
MNLARLSWPGSLALLGGTHGPIFSGVRSSLTIPGTCSIQSSGHHSGEASDRGIVISGMAKSTVVACWVNDVAFWTLRFVDFDHKLYTPILLGSWPGFTEVL